MTLKPLIVPVETQVREFDAKLLLCCVAAERRIPSYLGFQNRIRNRMPAFPAGILIAKGFAARKATMLDIVQRLGHRIYAWDEEGLVHSPPYVYHDRRMGKGSLDRISGLFSWGADYTQLIRSYPDYDGTPIYETGNPRVDLLRPELHSFYDDAVADIRGRFGRFVLINSSFGSSNAAVTQSDRAKGTASHLSASAEYWVAQLEFRNRVFALFREMVKEVAAAFPRTAIVLRPHPSEDLGSWDEIIEGHDNLHIVSEGNVVPWILASETVVHHGCMTAVEAVLLGRQPLAYRPLQSERYDRPLPDSISRSCFTLDELLTAVSERLERPASAAEIDALKKALDGHLDLDNERLCSERIMDVLEPIARDEEGWIPPRAGDRARGSLAANARGIGKWARSFRRDDIYSVWHQRQQFPRLELPEVERRIAALRHALGRFEHVTVRQTMTDVFGIESSL